MERGAAIQHIEDLRMATTPAAMETNRRRTHADAFREYLRNAPEFLTRDEIDDALLGSGKGFHTKTDINNRITQARASGDISSQGKDRRMKNFRSQVATPASSVKHINGGGSQPTPADDGAPLEAIVEEAEKTANDALTDLSITRTVILSHLLLLTSVFKTLRAHS
jgi:hypothetical protein